MPSSAPATAPSPRLATQPLPPATAWLRRCHATASQLLQASVDTDESLLESLRENSEHAQDAATTALATLRHASCDSWHNWAAAASAGGGGAAHPYICGRDAWQPAVMRRRADLQLSGRADCIIAHHTQTWADHWCRAVLSHYTDALITDALASHPQGDALPPLAPTHIRSAAHSSKLRTTKAPDGSRVRHFRIISDAGLAACALEVHRAQRRFPRSVRGAPSRSFPRSSKLASAQ